MLNTNQPSYGPIVNVDRWVIHHDYCGKPNPRGPVLPMMVASHLWPPRRTRLRRPRVLQVPSFTMYEEFGSDWVMSQSSTGWFIDGFKLYMRYITGLPIPPKWPLDFFSQRTSFNWYISVWPNWPLCFGRKDLILSEESQGLRAHRQICSVSAERCCYIYIYILVDLNIANID